MEYFHALSIKRPCVASSQTQEAQIRPFADIIVNIPGGSGMRGYQLWLNAPLGV